MAATAPRFRSETLKDSGLKNPFYYENKTEKYAPIFANALSLSGVVGDFKFESPVFWTRSYHSEDYRRIGRYFRDGKIPIYEYDDTSDPAAAAYLYTGDPWVAVQRFKFDTDAPHAKVIHEGTHMIQDERGKSLPGWVSEMEAFLAQALVTIKLKREPGTSPIEVACHEMATGYLATPAFYVSKEFIEIRDKAREALETAYGSNKMNSDIKYNGLPIGDS